MELNEENNAHVKLDWWSNRLHLWMFRFRAMNYAFHLEGRRPTPGLAKALLKGLQGVAAVFGILGALGWLWHLYPFPWSGHVRLETMLAVGLIAGLLSMTYSMVRYFSHLPRLIGWASVSGRDTARIIENMSTGMRNIEGYRQLRALYQENVASTNSWLKEQGYPKRFQYVDRDSDLKDRDGNHYGAAVVLPADGDTNLENILGIISSPQSGEWTAFTNGLAEDRRQLMRKWRTIDENVKLADESTHNYILGEMQIVHSTTTHGPTAHELRLNVGVATDGQVQRTCEALLNEYALFAYLTGTKRNAYKDPRAPSRPKIGLRVRRLIFDLHTRIFVATSDREHHRRLEMPAAYKQRAISMRPHTMLKCLPWRKAVHDGIKDPADLFRKPANHAAGLGIAVTTAKPIERGDGPALEEAAELGAEFGVGGLGDRSNEEVALWIALRSSVIGTNPGVLHVIPAGICKARDAPLLDHEPGTPVPPKYLTQAMKSEFMEKWLDNDVLEHARTGSWSNSVDTYWADGGDVRWGQAKPIREVTPLTYTGLAMDLLTLRPEICAYIEVEQFQSRLNWEYKGETPLIPLQPDRPLITDMSRLVQTGAASLALGSEYYKRLHNGLGWSIDLAERRRMEQLEEEVGQLHLKNEVLVALLQGYRS